MRNVLFLCLTLSLTSCSAIAPMLADAILPSGGGVEVDANVSKGDAEGEDSVVQNGNTNVNLDAGKEQTYGSVENVVNESGLPLHVLLLLVLLAGWAIPSPEEMGHGVVRLARALRGTSRR